MDDVKYYDDLKLGDKGTTPSVKVTKDMIKAFAELSGDHTPVHAHARLRSPRRRIRRRITGFASSSPRRTRFSPARRTGRAAGSGPQANRSQDV